MAARYSYSYTGDEPHPSGKGGGTGALWLVGIAGALWLGYDKFAKKPLERLEKGHEIQTQAKAMKAWIPSVKLFRKQIQIDLKVDNPNSVPMTVRAIVGRFDLFSLDGKQKYDLGMVNRFGTTIIKPVSQTNFPITVQLRTLPIIEYMSSLVTGKIKGQTLVFSGTINIDGEPWPVKTEYRIA
jgi:hypothetical protein